MKTQTERVLELLIMAGSRGITPLDALDYAGSFRLGARIFELREQGHNIRTERVKMASGANVACYVLVDDRQAVAPVVETRQQEPIWSETELRMAYGDR